MADRIRIMHCIRSLDIGNQGGGAEIFAINLSRELKKRGVETTLAVVLQFHTDAEKLWMERLTDEGFQVSFLSDSPQPRIATSWKEVRRLCSSQKFSIIHGHYQVGNLLACMLKIRGIIPHAIRTIHTPLEWGEGWIAWLARQTLTRWIFPSVMDLQIGVSSAIVHQVERYPGAKIFKRPIHMIPNAVNEQYLRIAKNNRLHLRPVNQGPKFVITSVGRITHLKGYQYLIQALPTVLKVLPDTELWLIGDGTDLPRLKNIASDLGVENHIHFWGQQENVGDWLQKSDLFVLPSLVEAMPTVILEAMACGVPVIASKLPGLEEIITEGRTGWLIPPKSPSYISDKIITVLLDPDLRYHTSRTSLELLEKFTLAELALDYYKIYQQLLLNRKK